MTIDALRLEVKKDKWEQLQNGTYKLQVTVNPADLNDNADDVLLQFIKAGMGERFMMGVAKIGPDEQPEQPKGAQASCKPLEQKAETSKHRPPATTRAEKARRLCGVVQFQDWMKDRNGVQNWPTEWHSKPARYQQVSFWIKQACNVQSKTELDPTDGATFCNAGNLWDALLAEYEQQAGRMAEIHG